MKGHERSLTRGLAVLALVALPWLLMGCAAAWRWGITVDEGSHFGAGLAYWHYGDFRMNSDHPPLAKAVFALPVYLIDPPAIDPATDRQIVNWQCSSQYHWGFDLLFRKPDGRHRERLFLARTGALAFGLAGGLVAFLWGRELARHNAGGWAAAAMLLYYPEYAGHATLLTYDIPMLAGGAAMSWAAWCWWKRPTIPRALAFAITCGIAAQLKAPVAMLSALQAGALLVAASLDSRRHMVGRAAMLAGLTVVAGVAGAWAGSLFRFELTAPGQTIFQRPPVIGPYDAASPSLMVRVLAFAYTHRLLPESAMATVAHTGYFADRHQMLLGEYSPLGWYQYFLVTILFKTPLLMLAGGVALLVAALRRWHWPMDSRLRRWRVARVWILAGGFAAMALLVANARINIGHRHILFLYFPWCVLLGAWAARAWMRGGRWRIASALLVASPVAALAWAFPGHSTYVNVLGGDRLRLSAILSDSNVDWGQDLPLVAPWMKANGHSRINLAQFGLGDRQSYGLTDYNWITPPHVLTLDPPDVVPPDPSVPSVVSLVALPNLRVAHPELFSRPPDQMLGSLAIFLPRSPASGS